MPQPYSNQQRQQFRYNTSRESGKYPASFYYPPGSPPPQRQLGGGDVQPSALSNQQLQQRQQYRDPADVYYPAGGSTAGGGSQRPQPYSDQRPQQYRDPADAYYPAGSAPVQSDMGNAYGYNTSRNDVSLSDMARAAATGGLSGHVARQLVGQPQQAGQPEPADGSTVGGGSQQNDYLMTPSDTMAGSRYDSPLGMRPNASPYATMPSPLAPSGGWLSRAQESLSKYYGMGRNFLSNIQSPEHQKRLLDYNTSTLLDYNTATPERLTQFGQNYARSLGEVTPESQAKYDEMLEPMRGALSLQSDLNEGRNRSTAEQADRLQREARGMTPAEIEQGNQEMYDENGNIRGTEPSIRGRLHDQDMADARDIYEGRSENIPYDQSIMNRAAEGANRQENQDFAAGKPGFADRFRNLPPAEDENTIRMRRQDRTSPLDPRGEYFTRRRRPLKERQQKMAQAGWTEDGKRIEGSASAERKADRRKVRVNKQTGGEIEWGESGYEDGVDISRGLYNEIQNGEQSPEMIRNVIRQDSRVYLNRKRRGGMSSHLANRLDNKARALSRNMAGKPMYNKKGKLIGRRAPTVKSLDQFQNSMVRSTGGIDWLAGAGQAHGDINKVPEPAPILALAPPSMNLLNGQVNQNTKGYWAHNEDRMNNGNSPVDQHDRGVIGQLGISDATTFAEVIDSLESSNFDNFLTDVFNNDGREPAKKSMLSVVRRLQQLYASQGSNAGSKNQMKMLRELNEPGALNINEMSDWLSKFRKLDVGDSGDLLRDITPTPSGSAIPYSPS